MVCDAWIVLPASTKEAVAAAQISFRLLLHNRKLIVHTLYLLHFQKYRFRNHVQRRFSTGEWLRFAHVDLHHIHPVKLKKLLIEMLTYIQLGQ